MSTNLEARQKEALLLLLTVFLLALLVGLLSNIIYDHYININRELFIIITAISLLITLIITYFIIIGTTSEVITTVMFPLCFSDKLKKFIDIERCVPSVHARIHFDRNPSGFKRELAKQAQNREFWGSDLEGFVNDVVQAIFLDLLFDGNSSAIREYLDTPSGRELFEAQSGEKTIPYANFPETIKRNSAIRRELEVSSEYSILIPEWAKFTTFGEYERFIQVKSKYGSLTLTWGVAPANTAYHSESYLTAMGIDPENDAHEYEVNAVLTYSYKHIYIHTKMLRAYLIWVQKIRRRFNELDWSLTREQLPLVVLQLLFSRWRSEN